MLVQLNKCFVVCGSDLRSDDCLSSSILFKYACSMGHLFVRSWARVLMAVRGSVVLECCTVSGMMFVTLLCC